MGRRCCRLARNAAINCHLGSIVATSTKCVYAILLFFLAQPHEHKRARAQHSWHGQLLCQKAKLIYWEHFCELRPACVGCDTARVEQRMAFVWHRINTQITYKYKFYCMRARVLGILIRFCSEFVKSSMHETERDKFAAELEWNDWCVCGVDVL